MRSGHETREGMIDPEFERKALERAEASMV